MFSFVKKLVKRVLITVYNADRCIGLTWKRRIYIALGSARGLQYLHSKSFYGSMRPENILLTHDYEPLV